MSRRPRITEKQVEQAVIRFYRTVGCLVFKLSQPRRTMQTPGIADLYVLCPRYHASWWHEVKADDGRLSPAQEQFVYKNAECNMIVVVGGLDEARSQLACLGLAA